MISPSSFVGNGNRFILVSEHINAPAIAGKNSLCIKLPTYCKASEISGNVFIM